MVKMRHKAFGNAGYRGGAPQPCRVDVNNAVCGKLSLIGKTPATATSENRILAVSRFYEKSIIKRSRYLELLLQVSASAVVSPQFLCAKLEVVFEEMVISDTGSGVTQTSVMDFYGFVTAQALQALASKVQNVSEKVAYLQQASLVIGRPIAN